MSMQFNISGVAENQPSLTAKTAGLAQPEYFSPEEYFLGILARAASSSTNVRITHPEMGSVTVFPEQKEYHSTVANMRAFCEAPANDFQVDKIHHDGEVSEDIRLQNLSELFWQAGFFASQGRLLNSRRGGESVHLYDVVSMLRWPNLTRLPQTPNTMRICALLTREPSAIMLVPRKLGITPEEVYQIYSAACGCGLIQIVSGHMGEVDALAKGADEEESAYSGKGLLRSLFVKLTGL